MKKQLYKIWAKFLTHFGNIKVFKFPMFMVYDPDDYAMDGQHVQTAISTLQPGDVVLRGYNHYLDGYFIDDLYGYSHGAIYIGDNKIIHAVSKNVSEIHAIDFMACDRICILRPSRDQQQAIENAKFFLAQNTPYDFSFSRGSSALYCFELCAEAYPSLDVKRIEVKKFFGLLKKHVYLADSFRKSKDFKIVFEYNPKHNVDTTKEKDDGESNK